MKKLITMFLAVVMILGVVAIPAMAEPIKRVQIDHDNYKVELGKTELVTWHWYPDNVTVEEGKILSWKAEEVGNNILDIAELHEPGDFPNGRAFEITGKKIGKTVVKVTLFIDVGKTDEQGNVIPELLVDKANVEVVPLMPEWVDIMADDQIIRDTDESVEAIVLFKPNVNTNIEGANIPFAFTYPEIKLPAKKQIAVIDFGKQFAPIPVPEMPGWYALPFTMKPVKLGTTTVTIWFNSTNGNQWKATFKVTVADQVLLDSVVVNDMEVEAGKTASVVYKVLPATANVTKVVFQTGDPLIATVDENGVVTAKGDIGTQTWIKVIVTSYDEVKDEEVVVEDKAFITIVPATAPAEQPPAETKPPKTGMISLAVLGISAILTGAGVVLFRKK